MSNRKKKVFDGPSTISARMRALGYSMDAKYSDYLDSRHWLHVKLRYSESGLPQNCACGKPPDALHHKTYVRLGNERLTDLEPVCDACHRKRHGPSAESPKRKAKRRASKRANVERYGYGYRRVSK